MVRDELALVQLRGRAHGRAAVGACRDGELPGLELPQHALERVELGTLLVDIGLVHLRGGVGRHRAPRSHTRSGPRQG